MNNRIFQYNAWDAHQPGVLARAHVNCSVIYDPNCRYHRYWRDRGMPCQLFCRFYLNRHRIYDKGEAVVAALWAETQKAEKRLFRWRAHENEQIIALMRPFEAVSLEGLQSEIYDAFLELIPY